MPRLSSVFYNMAGDSASVVVCFLQHVTVPRLSSVSFVTAGNNACSIAHTVFHTSQQVITHGLSSVSYVTESNKAWSIAHIGGCLCHGAQQELLGCSEVFFVQSTKGHWLEQGDRTRSDSCLLSSHATFIFICCGC